MAASKTITTAELRRAVEQGQVAPVYLLLGPEATLRRQAVEALQRPLIDPAEHPGALVTLDGPQVGIAAMIDEARSLPLFAMMGTRPARVIRVSDFDRAVQPKRGEGVADVDPSPLLEYLKSPVEESCLVLEATKLDKRTAVYKALAKNAVVVNCDSPQREGDLRRWVETRAREGGFQVDPDAVVYLVEMVGSSLTGLEQELEKAALYAGPGGRVTTRDLEGLTGRSRDHSVFELTDALVKRQLEGAVRVLNRLLDDGEHPLRVLPMVAWITRQLVIAHDLAASGCSRREAMDGIAGRWNQRGEILDRARGSKRVDLVAALAACADADLFVKRLRDTRPGGDRLRPARGRLEALCRQICAA